MKKFIQVKNHMNAKFARKHFHFLVVLRNMKEFTQVKNQPFEWRNVQERKQS